MEPVLFEGGNFKDNRGKIDFFNSFSFNDVKRFYIIKNQKTRPVRAWQGHKIEKKYFLAVNGSFMVCAVKIDDWENPSPNLRVYNFDLSDKNPKLLIVPPGYANGFKALTEDSNLLVFSNLNLDESQKDIYRFSQDLWYNWNTV